MRPLVLMHQDDPRTLSIEHTYYFGNDLLVAPVIEPKVTQRSLYLPEGTWFDFWTNERHTGKRDIVWKNPAQPAEPKSKIPVFVRSGAILPLILGDAVETLCDSNYVNNAAVKTWDGGIEVTIYPDGTSQFTMFDGTQINASVSAGATSIIITSAAARPVMLRIHALRPAAVRREGAVLTEVSSKAAFDVAVTAWRFDATPGFALVKFPHPGGTITISL